MASKKENYGIILSVERKNTSTKIIYAIIFTIISLISIVCIFPPIWILISGFKTPEEMLAVPQSLFPKTFQLEKLVMVWEKTKFATYYLNTVILVIGELLFCLLFNGLAGYVLSKLKPKGTALILSVILWTMMMPNSISMVPLFMTFVDFPLLHVNLTNTFLPMFLMAGANSFYILLFKNFYDTIPTEFLESARLDGCTNFGIFFKIIMPISTPILMVVSIFMVNGAWGSFFWPYLILKDSAHYVVSIAINNIKQTYSIDEYMIALLFVILPPALIFIFLQKHIIGGLNIGGVKG